MKFYKLSQGTCSIHCVDVNILYKSDYGMTKTEPTVLICPQKSVCFIDFLTYNAWNYGYQVHLKVGILWPMRPQKVTDWQWKDNWKHKEMGTWKMNRTSLNLVGKSVLAQSQPLIMHLNPRVSHLFHGIISVLTTLQWEDLKCMKWSQNIKHCYY